MDRNLTGMDGLMAAVLELARGGTVKYAGTIEIDGQKLNYTLTPTDGSVAVAPNGMRAVPGSPAAFTPGEQTFEVLLLSHTMKSDIGKNGKPYTRHAFKGSDNRTYVTFRDQVVSQLQPMVNSGKPVKLIGSQTKFGVDINFVDAASL